MTPDEIGRVVVDCALRLHVDLGPGLLESVYEVLLAHRLRGRGLAVEGQVSIPIEYDGIRFEEGFRIDLLVEKKVIVELKSVEKPNKAHEKQVLTYLRPTGLHLGYILNFGRPLMKSGISRIVNGLPE